MSLRSILRGLERFANRSGYWDLELTLGGWVLGVSRGIRSGRSLTRWNLPFGVLRSWYQVGALVLGSLKVPLPFVPDLTLGRGTLQYRLIVPRGRGFVQGDFGLSTQAFGKWKFWREQLEVKLVWGRDLAKQCVVFGLRMDLEWVLLRRDVVVDLGKVVLGQGAGRGIRVGFCWGKGKLQLPLW